MTELQGKPESRGPRIRIEFPGRNHSFLTPEIYMPINKFTRQLFGSILAAAFFAGCAAFDQTMLVPEPNGVYRAIALDQSDFTAQRSALNRASKTCSDRQMRSVVTNQITYFRGTDTG